MDSPLTDFSVPGDAAETILNGIAKSIPELTQAADCDITN
jgi:hypothetical protein